jgi:hypothetical protein
MEDAITERVGGALERNALQDSLVAEAGNSLDADVDETLACWQHDGKE